MPKRGENIHKRKDGRWEGRYKTGTDECGRTKYRSVYGHTYGQVKEKLKAVCFHTPVSSMIKTKEPRFGEILFLWMETNRIKFKGATENKYEYLIEKHIVPELGEMKVSSITTLVLNDFMNRKLQSGRLNRKGGLSPAYVRGIMLIVTSALRYAVNEQMCPPLNTPVYKPSVAARELPVLSVGAQQMFERRLMGDLNKTKLGILLALNTGLRIGEVCALSWDDIDFEEGILHVRSTVTRIKCKNNTGKKTMLVVDKPKTKASLRDIPIPSKLMPLLTSMKEQSTGKFVISENTGFLSPRTLEYRYHRLLEKCNIDSINFHALRHTFATRCIEVGVDVKTLSEVLGHANVAITLNTYVHSSMDLKRAQLEKLAVLLA